MLVASLGHVWEAYDKGHVSRHLVPSGQAQARWSWNNLGRYFAAMPADRLTAAAMREYEDRRRAGLIGRPSGARTIRRELAYLVAALKFAVEERVVEVAVPRLPKIPIGSPRRSCLTLDQAKGLLRSAAAIRGASARLTKIERFLWIALFTGARKSAILGLKWSHVDLALGVIDFRDPAIAITRKRRAVVPIAASLRPVLERAYSERQSDFVLDNPSDGIWGALQIVAHRAGMGGRPTPRGKCPLGTGISPHTLRHTAASLMARAGVSLFDIAGILGNTVAVIESTYAEHTVPNPCATVDRIGTIELKDGK